MNKSYHVLKNNYICRNNLNDKTMKIENEDFNIIERLSAGGGKNSLAARYPDIPFLGIGVSTIGISVCAQKKIGASVGSHVVFAIRNDIQYIAVVPILGTMKGYSLCKHPKSKNIYIPAKNILKRGIKSGIYELLDPIHKNDIDWFELYEININNL